MIHRRHCMTWMALLAMGGCAHAGAYDDFFTAIIRDDGGAINALVRRGFDPNTRDPKGQVGLTLALREGSMKAFDALMKAPGIKVEARNAQDESPLMMAAIKGNLPAARALIAKDADVNKTGWAPLHYAASCTTDDAAAMTNLLLENHAYIDAGSPNGTTPLMMAVRYGAADVARVLLKEGADVTIKNQLGMTAHDFAVGADRKDMVELIAEAMRRRQPPRQGKW
ncbi:ankyrin repeat domain-containing protein [Acidovorax sp. Leaf160]|uniref:ankyrin repeat domain-containing protein n=1 Tax=Acidovorax sp. Leaf160 TaxID=1736280 RepID=UPI0006F807F9|nr:ankyrin repeat domain-containing protein [Acidovorax sp. Leaf160]KQR62540.1 hypothetical protein ASF94_15010 [Acidovorax sp. Leaf160]